MTNKENEAYNNMLANIMPLHTHPRPLGWGQKAQHVSFLNAVMWYIKLTDMKLKHNVSNHFPFHISSASGWGQKFKTFVF